MFDIVPKLIHWQCIAQAQNGLRSMFLSVEANYEREPNFLANMAPGDTISQEMWPRGQFFFCGGGAGEFSARQGKATWTAK